jgi:class II lanthipeptide synthase
MGEDSSLTAAEIESIVRAAGRYSSKRSPRSGKLRELLAKLGEYRFGPRRAPPLTMLCRAGIDHAWREFEKECEGGGADLLSGKAKASLKRSLQTTLQRITRASFNLEWTSFTLALDSFGFPGSENATITIQMFLREKPGDRLGLLFKRFPALAHLWAVAIGQWHDHTLEILERTRRDQAALSRTFFCQKVDRRIMDLRLALSDPHHGGRSVALIEFSEGRRVIYKPRTGRNEAAWFSLLGWMNRQSFEPRQRLVRVLVRKDYCWMEHAKRTPCSSAAAVRRFYERLGGLIAAAYLLKAVDCHRENVIAAGEYPILVDVDALWHVSPVTKRMSAVEVLYRTGFFPNSRRGSLLSRSSVLGRWPHFARMGDRPIPRGSYEKEIIAGFTRGWLCLAGNAKRRAAFNRVAEQIRSSQRRWIYCATARYAAILRASLRPAVLRSNAEREMLITRHCLRSTTSDSVRRAEIKALTELNIPYFTRRTRGRMPPDPPQPPSQLIQAIRKALEWAES